MSSPLKQNTTALQELLDKINQLPEAGSGGGGEGLAPNARVYYVGKAQTSVQPRLDSAVR